MAWQYIAGAAVAAGIAYDYFTSSGPDHHEVVGKTYDALELALPSDANSFAAHQSDRDDVAHPKNIVDGLTHIPDVVVKAGSVSNLLIEVETADSLANNSGEAKSQLADFAKPGYRRLLVVPDSQQDHDEVAAFMDDINQNLSGTVHLATPSTVTSYL